MAPQRKPNSYLPAEGSPDPVPATLSMAEALRLAQPPDDLPPKAEDRTPVLWRVLGGTLLSIVVTLMVTVYQNVSGALAELRAGQARLAEAHGDCAKKDELAARTAQLWAAQKAAGDELPALRTRAAQLEVQVRSLEVERKEMQQALAALSERLARAEGRAAAAAPAVRKATTGPARAPRMDAISD